MQLGANMHSTWKACTVGLVVIGIGASASACAPPEAPAKERRSSTTSALGKPKPAMKTAASKETTKKYGITEWRMFRGKQDLYMTGYDAKGKAVRGVSLAFKESEENGEAELVTNINDGSKASVARNLTTEQLTADAIPASSAEFLELLTGDLGAITEVLAAAGIDIPESAVACGMSLATVCQLALQCCAAVQGGAVAASIETCLAAAQAAVTAGTECKAAGAEIAQGIDLSQVGLPTGVAGVNVGAIANVANPFAGKGRANLANVFKATDDLACSSANGDVDYQE